MSGYTTKEVYDLVEITVFTDIKKLRIRSTEPHVFIQLMERITLSFPEVKVRNEDFENLPSGQTYCWTFSHNEIVPLAWFTLQACTLLGWEPLNQTYLENLEIYRYKAKGTINKPS